MAKKRTTLRSSDVLKTLAEMDPLELALDGIMAVCLGFLMVLALLHLLAPHGTAMRRGIVHDVNLNVYSIVSVILLVVSLAVLYSEVPMRRLWSRRLSLLTVGVLVLSALYFVLAALLVIIGLVLR